MDGAGFKGAKMTHDYEEIWDEFVKRNGEQGFFAEAIRDALTLAAEHERVKKERDELARALQNIESKIRQKKGFYAISVGHDDVKKAHKAGILKGLDIVHEEVKQAISKVRNENGNA